MNKFTLEEFEKNIEGLTNEKIVLIGCKSPEVLRKAFNILKKKLENVYPLENSTFENIDSSLRKAWGMDIQDVEGSILVFLPDLVYDSSLIGSVSDTLVRLFNILGYRTNIIFVVNKEMLDDLASQTNDFQGLYRRLYGFEVAL